MQAGRSDVAVLGAGAAGLFAAGLLAQGGLRVVVLEHGPAPGRKILISGGGRANFTNLNTRPEHFLSENPHFARSALARYTPADFVTLVERHGIRYHAKTPGQLFCDGSARQIVEMLQAEAAGAELRLNTTIAGVEKDAEGFQIRWRNGPAAGVLGCAELVVATGGLSIPKLGATDFGYALAAQLGLRVVPPRPALVPLTLSPQDQESFAGLSGVSTQVEIRVRPPRRPPVSFTDKLLFTHRGLSGPAVLQASSYWQAGEPLLFDLAPGAAVTTPLRAPGARRDTAAALAAWSAVLPHRLAQRLLAAAPPRRWTDAALHESEALLHAWPLTPAGTEGYAKAEVTAGGVDTGELHAATMETRRLPGLYWIGEVVDVTGQLGGFNFQWAWASAAAAARAILGARQRG